MKDLKLKSVRGKFISPLNMIIMIIMILSTAGAWAQDSEHVISFQIGDVVVSALSEGEQKNNTANLIGVTPEILSKYVPEGTYPAGINAFLIRSDAKTILIDAGFGRNLFDNFKTLKTSSDKVDVILLTHMHGDHIGGLLKDGKPTFPDAEIYLPKPEHDYWTSDVEMNKTPENRRGSFLQARSVIALYKDKLHLFTPSEAGTDAEEIIPGIKAIAAYGHTPGHTGYLLESAGSRLFIWGDLTHAMAVQMPHPEVAITYDVNPEVAIAFRKKLLDYVAKNKIPVAGMHIALPSIGDVTVNGDGYKFSPFCNCLAL
jgi:glyoxylase-like metal-dependent hydrolase (beta-lactamase superfamily II)